MESQLSLEELSYVWDLSDVNRNGKLDQQEWSVTCHLIRALRQGKTKEGMVWHGKVQNKSIRSVSNYIPYV